MRTPHLTPRWARAAGLIATLAATGVACTASAQERGALARYEITDSRGQVWSLPNRLREISGLAADSAGTIYAHDDETGIIYAFDPAREQLVKAWAMGSPVPRDDFEGIAVVGDRFYLVNSNGRIYETGEGADGEQVLYNEYGTNVGAACEVEGLAHEPADHTLLLLCKTPRIDQLEGFVAIFRWSLATHKTVGAPILVDLDAITDQIDGRGLHPSGIERHPQTGTYFIIAAREAVVVEIEPDGTVLGVQALRRRSHPQVEGITFTPDGRLFLSDEGQTRRARINAYSPKADSIPPRQ